MTRIGIIGTGIFARDSHLPAIQQVDGLEVHGVYNRTKSKAVDFATQYAKISESQVFDSQDELINSPEIDAIDALVPVQFNRAIVEAAVKAGKPISIEKPIAAHLDDARAIVKLSQSTSVPILVLENWVYHSSVQQMKALLPKIGNVVTFTYQSTGPFAASKYHQTTWRQKPEHVGGYLSDGGVHQLALLTEVLGEVESVSGRAVQLREISGDIDTLNSFLNMKSGTFGTFLYGSYMGATEKIVKFTIFGTNGTLEYEHRPKSSQEPKITLYEGADAASAKAPQTFEVKEDAVNGVVAEFENFYQAVKANDKTKLKCTPEMAFHHFAIIVAGVESAQANGQLKQVERP